MKQPAFTAKIFAFLATLPGYNFFSLRAFKPHVADPEFDFQERLTVHRVNALGVAMLGEKLQLTQITRDGRVWKDQEQFQQNSTAHGVAILTSPKILVEARELPSLPTGNTESAINRAIVSNPAQVLRQSFDKDRRYHLVQLPAQRMSLVFSVPEPDLRRAEFDLQKAGLEVVRAFCGLASAVKVAMIDVRSRHPNANVLAVVDQQRCFLVGMNDGHLVVNKADDVSINELKLDDPTSIAETLEQAKRHALWSGSQGPLQMALYTTPTAQIPAIAQLESENVEILHQTISTSDLCFA